MSEILIGDEGPYTMVGDKFVPLPDWMKHLPEDNKIELGKIQRYNSDLKLSVLPMLGPLSHINLISQFQAQAEMLTDQERFDELKKCKMNPAYFMDNYCWIRHPQRGVIRFNLFDYQRYKVLPTIIHNQFMITRKFRQGGFSTEAASFAVWEALFETDREILIVSKSDREALNIMSICLQIWWNLPSWMRCDVIGKPSKHCLNLATGSRISAFTPKAGRSFSLSLLILDEAAFVPNMDEIWADVFPCVSAGGQVFVISTVNGMGNWYHGIYEGARKYENDFKVVDVRYTEHPDYAKPGWDEKMRRQLGDRKYRQEVLAEFLGSNETYMPFNHVKRLLDSTEKDFPIREASLPLPSGQLIEHAFMFWENRRSGAEYVMGCDVSAGLGEEGDYSTIEVIDVKNLKQVAEFQCNSISPAEFAKIIASMGKYYNNASAVIERNNFGTVVIEKLTDDLAYDNVYYETPNRAGLTVSKKTRQPMLEQVVTAICSGRIEIHSHRLAREWSTFIWNPKAKRPEHMPKCHDDLIFALAHAIAAREEVARGMAAFDAGDYEEEPMKQLFEFTEEQEEHYSNAIRGLDDEPLLPMMSDDVSYNEFGEKRKPSSGDDDWFDF